MLVGLDVDANGVDWQDWTGIGRKMEEGSVAISESEESGQVARQ